MGEALLVRRGGSGSGKKTAGDYNIGSQVYLNWNGVSTPFIVVHQGLPSSNYDSSCEGTWLMQMKCAVTGHMADGMTYNDYDGMFEFTSNYAERTRLHNYLNGEYLNKFDSQIRSTIKQVKIPYWNGSSIMNGANGFSTKPFFLSALEVGGITNSTAHTREGACLDYFAPADTSATTSNAVRIANVDNEYWLRSVQQNDWYVSYVQITNGVNSFSRYGSIQQESSVATFDDYSGEIYSYEEKGYRPAFIVDYKTVLED